MTERQPEMIVAGRRSRFEEIAIGTTAQRGAQTDDRAPHIQGIAGDTEWKATTETAQP